MTRPTLTAVAVVLATCLPRPAAAQFVYPIQITVPNTGGGGGNVQMNGTITSNTLGTINGSNLVDWNLSFASDRTGLRVLTPANSTLSTAGPFVAEARADRLDFLLYASTAPNLSFLSIGGSPSAGDAVNFYLPSGGGFVPQVQLYNRSQAFDDSGAIQFADVTAYRSFAPVPEPSAVLLFGSVAGGLVACGRRSRRPA